MEDRKRPSSYDAVDSAPPAKKQATSANGASKSHRDDDMPWKDDLDKFQKDAIYRQMQEFKRERNTLEAQLKEMRKKARYHDDHLRIIDAWFQQVIDEVKLVAKGDDDVDMDAESVLPSSLLFPDQEQFEDHLRSRSKQIKSVIARLFGATQPSAPDVADLQSQIAKLLAAEKGHVVELQRLQSKKDELEHQLETASLRYMTAERKMDRAKSSTVAKLEKQALMGATRSVDDGGTVKREESQANGTSDNAEELADLETELNKTAAASEKQKEQLKRLEEDNAKLTQQLTELQTKSATLTDEDYAKTELFKQLKSQHEDVLKRINNLEATNTELKEEATRLRSERTTCQLQLENEQRAAVAEKDSLLGASEANFHRIRQDRDERKADQEVKQAMLEQHYDSVKKINELCSAKEDRIMALESEIERLKTETQEMEVDDAALESLSLEDLRTRFRELDRKYKLLSGELSSMSSAYQKSSKIANQKTSEFALLEDKVAKISMDKEKANQKYFATAKAKELQANEIKTLRMQNTKSADAVSVLKEAEASSRALLATMEKQLAELKDALTYKTTEHRTIQQQNITSGLEISRLNTQVTELKNVSTSKDNKLASASAACRTAEAEVEELKSNIKDTRRQLEAWKSKSGQNEQYEMLRHIAYCNVCKKNLKNTLIKNCGHTFCDACVADRLNLRARKCPNCNKSFGLNDHMRITL